MPPGAGRTNKKPQSRVKKDFFQIGCGKSSNLLPKCACTYTKKVFCGAIR
jgi:hypothetical protein